MIRPLPGLLLLGLVAASPAWARPCTGPELQRIAVVPTGAAEGPGYLLRAGVTNRGAVTRSFSYSFPLPGVTPGEGAVHAHRIQPGQSVLLLLGSSQRRVSEAELRAALRLTCHD